jgi:hypothetical protein
MILGLKYVDAEDDLPTRTLVGDAVDLQLEPRHPTGSCAVAAYTVAAYYDGAKVGYLSHENRALWEALNPSGRSRAKVLGEILDEDGRLAGLDVEINVISDSHNQLAGSKCETAIEASRGRKTRRIIVGLAVLCLTVMASADNTGPGHPAFSRVAPHALAFIDRSPVVRNDAEFIDQQSRTLKLAQAITANDQFVSMHKLKSIITDDGNSEHLQAQELSRMNQRASAHRLAMYLKRRDDATLSLQQLEMRKANQLVEDLRYARQAATRQQIRLAGLERQAWQTALHLDAENRKLNDDIAQLQRRIEDMTFAQQDLAAEKRHQVALKVRNQEKMVRYKNKMAVQTVVNGGALTQEKPKSSLQQVPKEEVRAASAVSTDKTKRRKKANFSRYVQETNDVE